MGQYTLTKKAQIWGLDLVIAMIIFLGGVFLFYNYSINSAFGEEQSIEELTTNAKVMSSYLVSTGYPTNWNSSDVTLIGLTDGQNKLVKEKVDTFSSISLSDYSMARRLLSATNNFYVYFEDSQNSTIFIGNYSFIGKDYSYDDPDNIIKIVRYVFYNSTIIKMVILVW